MWIFCNFVSCTLDCLQEVGRVWENTLFHSFPPTIHPPNCTRLIWMVKAGDCVQMCLESGQALCPERTCGLGLFTLALSQINPHTTCKASQDTTHTARFSPPPFRNFSAFAFKGIVNPRLKNLLNFHLCVGPNVYDFLFQCMWDI